MYWDPSGHNWWSDATAWAGDVVKTVAGAVVNTAKSTAKEALQTVAQATDKLGNAVKTAFTQKNGIQNAVNAYFDYQDTPLKLIDIACKNVNKLQTQVMEYTEKKLGIDTNNGVVKAVNNVGKFSLGWSEGVVQWTASAVTGAAKLINPLYGSYVGSKTKDTVESIINTPTYQQIFSGIQKNPTDVIGNAGKLYSANWNLAISYVQNQYNETIQDPYKCGQFASKATLDVASLCLGVGEATSASDAAKADLAVAEAEKVADTAVDVGKIAANSADAAVDVGKIATYSADDIANVAASEDELIHVYRGTSNVAEKMAYDETGHLLSDAALSTYMESGSLDAAYETAKLTHKSWLEIWGSETEYVQAHGGFGFELSREFQLDRTLISVSTDRTIAERFAGQYGTVYEAFLPKSTLIPQTLIGAGESEFLIKYGSGGFI